MRRRNVKRTSDAPPSDCIEPEPRKLSYANSKIYKQLWGHITKEVALQLPEKNVACWDDGHTLILPVCASNKFIKERKCCKRCSLFQDDEYSQILLKCIEDLEKDELENGETLDENNLLD